jgi:hypothetical protein
MRLVTLATPAAASPTAACTFALLSIAPPTQLAMSTARRGLSLAVLLLFCKIQPIFSLIGLVGVCSIRAKSRFAGFNHLVLFHGLFITGFLFQHGLILSSTCFIFKNRKSV